MNPFTVIVKKEFMKWHTQDVRCQCRGQNPERLCGSWLSVWEILWDLSMAGLGSVKCWGLSPAVVRTV